jgi:radical SAM superfamily enzyme YgiQ (UPF0313 family)
MQSTIKDYTQWYETNYPQLTNYGLWLKGNEINTLPKDEYTKRPFRILFTRLSTYNDVSSSFTHQLLYQIASEVPDVFPDIAYLPSENDAKIFKKNNIPWLLGTQTKFGPDAFSVIGFSNSIIQEILNIPVFLKTSNIPLKRSERINREDVPLLLLGGANAIHTSAIWGKDSLVDGIFTGTNTAEIKTLFEICRDGKKNRKTKQNILKDLKKIPGFYLSDTLEKKDKKKKQTPSIIEPLKKGIVSYSTEEMGSSYLEISEGCRCLCSFCAESWTRKPYRELDSATLTKNALKMKAEMGLEKIDLFSFNFNMHSEIYKLLWKLSPLFKSIGLKSQRFDMLALDPAMIEYEIAAGKTSISSGLEGISSRLRRYLNKNLSEDSLRKSIDIIFKNKLREVKIFLLSTGIENSDDFQEFDQLLSEIKKSKEDFWANTRVIFSITPLVKFPWTPLEFDTAYLPETHKKIIKAMRQIIANYNFEVREAMETDEYLISQILVRASDTNILNAMLNALEKTDFVYYRKISPEFLYEFLENLKQLGLIEEKLLDGFSLDESNNKPWSTIDTGITKDALWNIFLENSHFEETGPIIENEIIERSTFTVKQYKEKAAKTNEIEKSFCVSIKENCRGIPRKYIGLALARAAMIANESLTPYFHSYASSFWESDGLKPAWTTGDDILKLLFDKNAIPIIEKSMKETAFINKINQNLERWAILKNTSTPSKPYFKILIESQYKFNETTYFKNRGLKYTLIKKEENLYCMEFTKDSIKKGIISQLLYKTKKQDPYSTTIEITSGQKFIPEEFIKESFDYPQKNDWIKIKNTATMHIA